MSVWVVQEECCDGHIIAYVATEAEAKEAYEWYVRENKGNYSYFKIVPWKWEPPYKDWAPTEEVVPLSQTIGDLISLTKQEV